MRTRWLVVGGTILALAVASGGWYASRRSSSAGPWLTESVTRGPVASRVTAGGTVSALVTVQVGSQVSGRILTLGADFNTVVTKGQVLATMDPRLFEAACTQAKANLAAARANLAKAKATLIEAERETSRRSGLFAQHIVTQVDLEAAQTSQLIAEAGVAQAEAGVAQAEASLAQAQTNLAYTTITSPIDGVVIARNVDVGQTVAATLQAPVLFTIAEDLRTMQVDTQVAEADVGRIRDGMPVTFKVDAWPDQTFAGTVRQVRHAPQVVQNVVTYDAVIDVANPELRLRPGMTARVSFTTAEADNALLVPNAALRLRLSQEQLAAAGVEADVAGESGVDAPAKAEGRRRSLWVLRDGRPVKLRVQAGITDGSATEIVAGDLKPGELVLVGTTLAGPKGTSIPGMPAVPAGARKRIF